MPYDVAIFSASTGGTRYDPPQLEFAVPAAADEEQTVTVWVQNVGTGTVPAGAFIMMCDPWELVAGVINEWPWRRNQSVNVQRHVLFSTDGGTTWHSRAWLPSLPSMGTRQAVVVKWTSPSNWDDFRAGPEVLDGYTYPVPGMANDWPPVVGLEVAIGSRPYLVDSFAHWQLGTPSASWIAQKWDFIWAGLGPDDWIDPTGGPRGGKCLYINEKQQEIELFGRNVYNHRQEMINIEDWDRYIAGMVLGARVQLGEGGVFTENGVPVMHMTPTGSNNYPIQFNMGEDGALRCVAWANIGGVTGYHDLHTITPTWGPDDYVYLELALKADPDGSNFTEAAFAVGGNVVWTGALNMDTPRFAIEFCALGCFEYGYFPNPHAEPYFIRLRYADAYVAELAGPVDQGFLGPIQVLHAVPSADGIYGNEEYGGVPFGWSRRYPASPVNPLYTYVDEPEWDMHNGTWIASKSVAEGDHYWFRDPRVSFIQNGDWTGKEIVAVQPYAIGGGFSLTDPGNEITNYEWSAFLVSDPVNFLELVTFPNQATNWPWQIAYRTLSTNPWTRSLWTAGDVATLECGAAMTCHHDTDWGTNTVVFAVTQAGLEVAVRDAIPPMAFAYGIIVGL